MPFNSSIMQILQKIYKQMDGGKFYSLMMHCKLAKKVKKQRFGIIRCYKNQFNSE